MLPVGLGAAVSLPIGLGFCIPGIVNIRFFLPFSLISILVFFSNPFSMSFFIHALIVRSDTPNSLARLELVI